MMHCIQFTIPGRPQQRGSKQPFVVRNKFKQMLRRGGGIITESTQVPIVVLPDDNKQSKAFMAVVSRYAQINKPEETITGPVVFEAIFYFARPKKHYRTGKFAHLLRDDAPMYHTQKPDLAKLIRGVEDAITHAKVWKDDSQVFTYGDTRKDWTDQPEGFTVITITPVSNEDQQRLGARTDAEMPF